jgi:CheY-like chemotaxis protein/anti-sigma regulatory factor (Ser/Thr protein kinase)
MLGDPDRLQQVLWNLLSNAVKFTREGGRVELRLTALPDGARISVADTGKGIAPDFLPYVFERFRQADSGSTRAQAGLGLGLAIVRHLVELHGGTVTAESAGVGKGATFIVHLPHRAPTGIAAFRPAMIEPPAVPTSALRGLRVLIVDDNPLTCELLTTILVREGAETSAATSAADALALLEKSAPDILVSDIAMPGTDGYELIRRVRSRSGDGLADLPAVALTAYARPEDRERAIAAGFDGHISKPAEPAEFIRFLAQIAQKLRPRRP